MTSKIGYRRDIQVIRGLAVFVVVAYHLGINGFENGYLVVDLFFVINGYMKKTIYTNSEIKSFYLRRVRRLLPAYFVSITITMLSGFILSVPSDFNQLVNQSRWSLLLIPNIYFWKQESYFASSGFSPLLHLWSLGVEFQFYLLVPLLAFLNKKINILSK